MSTAKRSETGVAASTAAKRSRSASVNGNLGGRRFNISSARYLAERLLFMLRLFAIRKIFCFKSALSFSRLAAVTHAKQERHAAPTRLPASALPDILSRNPTTPTTVTNANDPAKYRDVPESQY